MFKWSGKTSLTAQKIINLALEIGANGILSYPECQFWHIFEGVGIL
jgi:hypothetical protein